MHKLEAARKKFADFVDRVLLLHSGCTINKFRLSFNYVPAAKLGRRIDTWIRLAFTSDIREIHLRFHDGKLMPHFMMPEFLDELDIYELPHNHFSPRFLKSLTLHCCKFKASEFRRFELLQKLVLSSVLLLDSSVTVITSKCPVLEDLHLEECIISHDFLVSEVDLKIKHLFFNRCYPLTMPTFQMDISTPHLETLAVSGCFVTEPYVRKATKLLSTGISIKTMSMTNAQETVLASFFAGLHSCQTLKLIGWSIQALPTCRTMTQQTAILFPHLIHLSLVGGLGKQELPKIVNLLGRCENLELLTIDVVKTLYLPALDAHANANQAIPGFNENNFWQSQDWPYCYPQKHLKKVKLAGFTGTKHEKNLLRFLLAKAEVLDRMSISYLVKDTKQSMRAQEAINEIMRFDRASRMSQLWIDPTT